MVPRLLNPVPPHPAISDENTPSWLPEYLQESWSATSSDLDLRFLIHAVAALIVHHLQESSELPKVLQLTAVYERLIKTQHALGDDGEARDRALVDAADAVLAAGRGVERDGMAQ